MSRHKLVKNLDLDDELDDYDGVDYLEGEGGEELSEEDQEQMRIGTIKVREALPPGTPHIAEKQIQETLWHYYYDVDKSVTYLVNTYAAKEKTTPVKKAKGRSIFYLSSENTRPVNRISREGTSGVSFLKTLPISAEKFSYEEFFRDSPWLNIPSDREAVFIAPLYSRGGLLGGSPAGAPKISKLQALAAARKKKAREQSRGTSLEDQSTVDIESNNSGSSHHLSNVSTKNNEDERVLSSSENQPSRALPFRKRKILDSQDIKIENRSMTQSKLNLENKNLEIYVANPHVEQAAPSAFASTMFNSISEARIDQKTSIFTLPYTTTQGLISTNPFAGPSPDDVVLAAQSKAISKAAKGPPKTANEKKLAQISAGVESMKVDDTPRATSKNLDVIAEYQKKKMKTALNFIVIGHVDAGKSTLMGRLLYDLNVVDNRTIERYRKDAEKLGKSSFALAWVMDQGTEERARGVTIDTATHKFETEKMTFTILDAPGHQDFIPSMISGASQADFAVLVIDASIGSFEAGLRGQTKEHTLLVRSMGIQRVIIVVNQLDNVGWSKDRFDEISQQISAFLSSVGFPTQKISFIPCSGLHGDNITRRSTETSAAWYTGPILIEELENCEPLTRALDQPLRISISDVFRGGIQNPLSISGRIDSGTLQTGDALLVQPSNEKCYIKSVEVDGSPEDWAVAGQNVTLHLIDIDPVHLRIGDVLCSPLNPIQNIKEFTARILAFDFLTPMPIDVQKGPLRAVGKIKRIIELLDKENKTGKSSKRPRIVKPGATARVLVELDTSVPLEAPARLALRIGGKTAATGVMD